MGRKKKEIKIKEPVRIREKRLNDGNVSLYLDMYYRGVRKKEGLKLYLVPETDVAAKLQNRNTRKLAEQIKAQRILDIQKKGLVNWEDVKKARMTLSAWVTKYTAEENGLSPASMRSKRNAQARVEEYLLYIGKPTLALKEVDKDFCKGFIAFLKTCTFNQGRKTLSSTTCRIFMNRLAAALNKAVSEGVDRPQPIQAVGDKGEAAETERHARVPDHRGTSPTDGHAVPLRHCEKGFSVFLLHRTSVQRHDDLEMERNPQGS